MKHRQFSLYNTKKSIKGKTIQPTYIQRNMVELSRKHFAVDTTMHFLCVVVDDLNVTVNYIKILSVAQQCFYCKFKSLATRQIIQTNF
jgi:hypothetical protein